MYKKYGLPLLAKLFGTKVIGIDQAKACSECGCKVTMYAFQGKYYITKIEYIDNKEHANVEKA